MSTGRNTSEGARLLDRYTAAIENAWRAREQMNPQRRQRQELEFLPAALSLRDTPVHPAPRVANTVVMALLLVALIWAAFGKVDVVASAEGKIVPQEDVKLLQPKETAVVTAIRVRDGEHVRRGQVLLDLDATDASTSSEHTRSDLLSARAEAARARAMLDAMDANRSPQLADIEGMGSEDKAQQERVLAGEYSDYVSNHQALEFDVQQAVANLRQTQAEIAKVSQVLPIEEIKERDYAKLVVPGYVGLHDYYNEQQAVIQLRQNLAEEQAKLVQLRAARDGAEKKRDAYLAQTRRQWLEKASDDETKASGLTQDLAKYLEHKGLTHLQAPVDGVLQKLAVHTVGGVVTPAQVLAEVVPDQDELIAQVSVDNLDIGFVKEGQQVEIKVSTFPYTRYGTIAGRVVQVSNDATQDESKRWTFPAKISLSRSALKIDGRSVSLVPGMEVTADVKTDRRSVLSYLLSPLEQHASEAMRER